LLAAVPLPQVNAAWKQSCCTLCCIIVAIAYLRFCCCHFWYFC
jgi:hypothetical protein